MGTTYDKKQFVRAWKGASCVRQAAKAARCTESMARSRACALRKSGVRLKRFPPGRKAP